MEKLSTLYSMDMAVDRVRIGRMAAAGCSNREIARELGCSHTRVAQVLAQDGRYTFTATVRAINSRQIMIDTDDAQVVGVLIKRAIERAQSQGGMHTWMQD